MGDHQGGAALHERLKGLLHPGLGGRVKGAGGLVEDEDRRVLEDDAGNGQPLAFAAAQV